MLFQETFNKIMNFVSRKYVSNVFEGWGNIALPIQEEIINEIPWLTVSKGNLEFILDEHCVLTLNLNEIVQLFSEKKIDFRENRFPFMTCIHYSIHTIAYSFSFDDEGKYLDTSFCHKTPWLWLKFDGTQLWEMSIVGTSLFSDQELDIIFKAMAGPRTSP